MWSFPGADGVEQGFVSDVLTVGDMDGVAVLPQASEHQAGASALVDDASVVDGASVASDDASAKKKSGFKRGNKRPRKSVSVIDEYYALMVKNESSREKG